MKDQSRLIKIAALLEEKYGPIPWKSEGDPLDVLILTILSQNTSDINRDRAYEALTGHFSSYQEIVDATQDEVAEVIKCGGMHHQKSGRIQQVLRDIYAEQGEFDLSYLWNLSTEEVLADLLKHKGIGKKTAGIVLTFSLNKPYFPVDTHVGRISQRLEFLKKNEDAHDVMNELVPDELIYAFHLHLIYHGRETCKARNPLCDQCVISKHCPFPAKSD
jgi:endonuclease-3